MLMTEQEAKQRWCPMARATLYMRGDLPDTDRPVDVTGHGVNRIITDVPELTASIQRSIDECGATKCFASACMAWRWIDSLRIYPDHKRLGHYEEATVEPPRHHSVPASWEWVPASYDTEGWCGWQEPEQEAQARMEAFNASGRRGYCGAYGKPEV